MSEPRRAMQNLAEFLVEDILSLTDEEVIAEIIEDGGDPDKIATDMRLMFERVWAEVRATERQR